MRWLARPAAALRRRPNVALAVAVALFCLAVGLATGFWLLFRMAYVLLLGVPLLWFWNRSMIGNLEVDALRRDRRVTRGGEIAGRVVVRSRSRLPKVWLEVEDASDLPGHVAHRVVTLGSRGVEVWRYRTPALRRGLYRLGPITVTSADPFGFFRMSRTFGEEAEVLIYPNAPELPGLYLPPANLPGDGRFRRRTQNVTPNVAGVRGYEAGDSFSRVHWPATARTGNLMVKLFELDPASDVWIMLDLERGAHAGEGDDGTEETAVTIAAAIARYFVAANRSVGLMACGEDLRVDEPGRGANHYARILETLALARAVGDVPLSRLLLEESRNFGRHTTVVAVSPSPDDGWALALMSLASRGVKVAAVLLEAETFGSEAGSLDVYGTLAAGGVYAYTVKRGDDLAHALSGAAGGGGGARAHAAGTARP